MNQITLCGYLTRDFELIKSNELIIARNFLAIQETYKSKEEVKKQVDFIPIVLFAKRAEIALKYLKKGDKFLGTGKLRTSSYTDEGGQIRYTWQVIINQFEFVNGKNSDKSEVKTPIELDESLLKEKDLKEKSEQLQSNEETIF